ncbi:MAG: hypothetical protein AAB152_03600 [Candidatus Coatesbacteria bacterium]
MTPTWDAVRLLGHSSPTMTANHYRGAWMESRTRAVNALEKALGSEAEGTLAEKWAVAPAGNVSTGQGK